jgi:hypothetical protein
VGSALAYGGIPLQSTYCGSKHALKGFFDSVRCELRHTKSNVHMTMVHLPGLNTPQFEHCLAKTSNHPMPVPPIYQPEVGARAVYWAAHSRRREHYVGVPTVYTIWGNKLAPWFAEWYLARTGFDAQQIPDVPLDPDRPVNLYEPLSQDEGAHGRFDGQAHDTSVQAWLAEHKGAVGAVAAAGAGAIATGLLSLRR